MIGAITAGLFAGAGAPAETNSYESIATTTVGGGGSATISFSSIPSTFKHLQLRIIARSTAGGSSVTGMNCSINSSVNAVRNHYLYGNGSSASAGSQVANQIGWATGTSMLASTFATSIVDILDYQNTNKNKTFRMLSGDDTNGAGDIALFSQLFDTTAAISTLTLSLGAGNFAQYSQAALYGIRG
jgi:hypothetical protein